MHVLTNNTKWILSHDALPLGTTTNSLGGAIIDMAQDDGYDAVCFVATLGATTAAAVSMTVQFSASTSTADFVSSTNLTASSTLKNGFLVLDVPGGITTRYVRTILNATSTTADVGGVTAILYNPRVAPTTSVSTDVLVRVVSLST